MKKISTAQLKLIHTLLSKLGMMEYKQQLVLQYTNARTASSREMTNTEARDLINMLFHADPNFRMRQKVFALAYEAGIIWGDSWEDKKINVVKLNTFLKQRGTVKKELTRMTKEELIETVNQFELIVYHNEEAKAARAAEEMLNELGIPTPKKPGRKRKQSI